MHQARSQLDTLNLINHVVKNTDVEVIRKLPITKVSPG